MDDDPMLEALGVMIVNFVESKGDAAAYRDVYCFAKGCYMPKFEAAISYCIKKGDLKIVRCRNSLLVYIPGDSNDK